MARMKEVNLHRKPTTKWVESKFQSMMDVVFQIHHIMCTLTMLLFPNMRIHEEWFSSVIQTVLQRHPTEDEAYLAILLLVRAVYSSRQSRDIRDRIRDLLCYGSVKDFLDHIDSVLPHQIVPQDLGYDLWLAHELVASGTDRVFPSHPAFFGMVVAFALDTCMVHPCTAGTLRQAREWYGHYVKK